MKDIIKEMDLDINNTKQDINNTIKNINNIIKKYESITLDEMDEDAIDNNLTLINSAKILLKEAISEMEK